MMISSHLFRPDDVIWNGDKILIYLMAILSVNGLWTDAEFSQPIPPLPSGVEKYKIYGLLYKKPNFIVVASLLH